jgi:histidinol-phosphatase
VVAGVVSAPALGSRWYASRGHGAYRDRKRIRVSALSSLAQAQVFHPGLKDSHAEFMPPGYAAVFRQAARTRGFGDFYQHVLVAEGAGELAIDPKVKPWDVAPLMVILEEAGGRATSLPGDRSLDGGSLLTSNGLVHDEAVKLLSGQKHTD